MYSSEKLWISYGIGLFIAALAAAAGVAAMLISNASYSLDFSTILRTVRNANMDIELREEDTDGRNPLAPYLAKARIRLARKDPEAKDVPTGTVVSGAAGASSPLLNNTPVQEEHSASAQPLMQRRTM